jgi:hypothetical protein
MPARNMRVTLNSESELDKLAEISASDVERAQARWHQVAPLGFRDLADVTELTGDAVPDLEQ